MSTYSFFVQAVFSFCGDKGGGTSMMEFSIFFSFKGADYKSTDPWSVHVEVGEIEGGAKIVTGQNPQSSEACAKKMLEVLG